MIYNFIVQLVIALIFFVVGELLRPKPDFENAEAVPFEDLPLPQNNPQNKQQVTWGRTRVTGMHIMDLMDYETVPITKKVKTSIFDSERVVVGHRYFIGMQLGAVKGPAVLKAIFYDDELLWEGTAGVSADGVEIVINEPNFLGGKENGGGIAGTFRWFSGGPQQNPSTYLQQFQDPCPAYRWTSYLLLEKVEIGERPEIDGFSVMVERYPDPAGWGNTLTKVDGTEANVDINMMNIAVELLTDTDFGFGLPINTDLDLTAFQAAATTLDAENNGMSLKWVNNQTIERLIDTINKQADGILRFDPKTGKWAYKLVRDDFDVDDLLVLDSSNIQALKQFSRANWDETINYVEINYQDRDLTRKPPAAKAYDRSNFGRQGRHKILSLTFPGLYSPETARNIASREIRQGAFALASGELIANREAWDLLPGDPFVLRWEEELGMTQLVCRVGGMGFGDSDQTEIQIQFVEDIFQLATNVFTAPPSVSPPALSGNPVAISQYKIVDQPYFFNLKDLGASAPGTTHKPMVVAAAPQGNSLHFNIFQRADGSSAAFVIESSNGYGPHGVLQSALSESQADDTTITVTSVAYPTLLDDLTGTSAEIDSKIRNQGMNLALVISTVIDPFNGSLVYEPEIIAYETVSRTGTTVVLEGIKRGLGDTLPIAANAGDKIWFLTGEQIFGPGTTASEFGSTEVREFRLSNRATTGESAQTSAVDFTFRNRVAKPYPAANVKFNTVRYPSSLVAIGADLTITWDDRDRLLGDLKYQDSGNETIETGREVVIRIYSGGPLGGTLVRKVVESGSSITADGSETLDTYTGNSYNYTSAKQTTDGGGSAMSQVRVQLRVTNSAQSLNNLVDVIRVINIDTVLNILKRGPLYHVIRDSQPTVYYPLQETSGDFEPVIGLTGPDAVVTGPIAHAQNGAGQFEKAPLVPAVLNRYISIADHSTNQNTGEVAISFWFRCGPVDGINETPLAYKGSLTDISQYSWYIYLDTSARLRLALNPGADLTLPLTSQRLDDGRWHQVVIGGTNGTVVFVDGQTYSRTPTGDNFPSPYSGPVVLAGHNDSSSAGLADIQIEHFTIWDDQGIVDDGINTNLTGANRFAKFVRDSYKAVILQRHAYLRAVAGLAPDFHLEMNFGIVEDGFHSSIWYTPLFGTSMTKTSTFYHVNMWEGSNLGASNVGLAGPLTNQRSVAVKGDGTGYFPLGQPGQTTTYDGTIANVAVQLKNMTFAAWIKLPTSYTGNRVIWGHIEVGASGQSRALFTVDSNRRLNVFGSANASDGNTSNRVVETGDAGTELDEDTWYLIGFVAQEGQRHKLYVNGRLIPSTETVSGTAVSGDLADQFNGATVVEMTLMGSLATTSGEGNSNFNGHMAHVSMWFSAKSGDVFATLFAAAKAPELSMEEMLSRDNPQHVISVESSTDAADLFDNAGDGQPTASGTFATNALTLEADGDSASVVTPAGFRGGERLAYASALLEAKSTTDLDDITIFAAFRNYLTVANGAILYNNDSNGGEASDDANIIIEARTSDPQAGGDNDLIRWDVDPPSSQSLSTPDNSLGYGVAKIVGLRENGSGAGKTRRIFENSVQTATDTGNNDEYTGAAVDRLLLGNRNTGSNLFFNGDIAYVGGYDRSVDLTIVRRVGLKFQGYNKYEIAVLQHGIISLIMATEDLSLSPVLHNSSPVGTKDMTIVGTPPSVGPNGPLGFAFPSAAQLTNVSGGTGVSGVTEVSPTPPICFGGWMRVDLSGQDAFIALSNNGANDTWLAAGIFGNTAGLKIGGAVSDVTITSGAVTLGQWAHVVVVITSSSNKSVYLNGVLQVNNLVNHTLPSVLNTQTINMISENVGNTFGRGSYCGVFFGNVALTANQVMEIYSEGLNDCYAAAAKGDGATMFYPFDEYIDSQLVFHDNINRTKKAVGTGLSQGVVGINVQRKSLCVQLDGSGSINAQRTDYPSGSASRTFECLLSGGFKGVVCSMGANTDAQSFTVAVDPNGDVRVHIRGTGNERIFAADIHTASSPVHLAVEVAGTALTNVNCYVNGVLATPTTAGNATTLNTTATENLRIGGLHANLTTLPDGPTDPYIDATGKIQGFAVYASQLGSTTVRSAAKLLHHYDLVN